MVGEFHVARNEETKQKDLRIKFVFDVIRIPLAFIQFHRDELERFSVGANKLKLHLGIVSEIVRIGIPRSQRQKRK